MWSVDKFSFAWIFKTCLEIGHEDDQTKQIHPFSGAVLVSTKIGTHPNQTQLRQFRVHVSSSLPLVRKSAGYQWQCRPGRSRRPWRRGTRQRHSLWPLPGRFPARNVSGEITWVSLSFTSQGEFRNWWELENILLIYCTWILFWMYCKLQGEHVENNKSISDVFWIDPWMMDTYHHLLQAAFIWVHLCHADKKPTSTHNQSAT